MLEKTKNPARFRIYDINNTYMIFRAKQEDKKVNKYLTIKEYATKNKISIFNTMKLIKSNKVEYITKNIDGKEQFFIKDKKVQIDKKESKKDKTIKELEAEIELLKKRVEILEKKIESKL